MRACRTCTFVLDECADLLVFDQQFGELLLRGVPAALPADHDAGAKTDRIDFLTHNRSYSQSQVHACDVSSVKFQRVQRHVDVRHPLLDHEGHAAGVRLHALEHRAAVDAGIGHHQVAAGSGPGGLRRWPRRFCSTFSSIRARAAAGTSGCSRPRRRACRGSSPPAAAPCGR